MSKNKITLEIDEELGIILLHFLGVQDIEDTLKIKTKYNLKGKLIDYEIALQELYDCLYNELDCEV